MLKLSAKDCERITRETGREIVTPLDTEGTKELMLKLEKAFKESPKEFKITVGDIEKIVKID